MRSRAKKALLMLAGAVAVVIFIQQFYAYAPDEGKLGGPIRGLTAAQVRKFYETREVFKREFTPEEGLGPLFNGKSCFECHGQPNAIGGEGRDVAATGVVRIGTRAANTPKSKLPLKQVITELSQLDVNSMFEYGGPALERKSITSEFVYKYPADCQINFLTVPKGTELVSMRHAGPLFGFGLIEGIADRDIVANTFHQLDLSPKLAGRALSEEDPLANTARIGRFGWKCQNPNLMLFTMEAMNVEMGLTTYFQQFNKSGFNVNRFPHCILKYLPDEPNDTGKITNQLTYFQALLAPPDRGPTTPQVKQGEKIFQQLQCAVCHVPEMRTAPVVYIVDPDSPAPKLQWLEIKALEGQPVKAYSDLLVHQMGEELADGLPQSGARGGEWRTTPLWGLRYKKFLLHDGRTTDIRQAILAHGGQADEVVANYKKLPEPEKEDLLAFLQSL